MKPRLLYLITLAERGGAQAHVLDLLQAFGGQYDLHLAVGERGLLTESAERLGVPVHVLPGMRRAIHPVRDWVAYRECGQLLRRLQPALLHAHSSKAGLIGRLAARSAGVPAVFTAHGWGFTPGVPALRRAIARVSEWVAGPLSARIICVSEYDRHLALRAGIGRPETVVAIPYGIESAGGTAVEHDRPLPLILMVARFNEQKDQPTLLRAVARLKERGVGLKVCLAGNGPHLEACRVLAAQLGVADRVDFLGDRSDVGTLLQDADAFVLSTHYEGFPISILEAMRAGLAVVATDVNGVREEVLHERTGLLVPRQDDAALADALARIAGGAAWRRGLGTAGRARFLAEFTREHMVARIDRVYRDVLNQAVHGNDSPQ